MTAEAKDAASFLREEHETAGARFQELRGVKRARHYGDPRAEYRAAVEGVGLVDRSHRGRWVLSGRDPARMLDGIVTNALPEPPRAASEDVRAGDGAYGAVLTANGKMVTDHRVFRWGGDDEGAFLLDLPPAGLEGLRAHFEKYLPPLFAEADERTGETGMLTVVGPEAAALVSREALGLRVGDDELDDMDENEYRLVGRSPEEGVRVVRCGEVGVPAFDLLADASTVAALWRRFRDEGVRPVGTGTWETLRVEAGRPAFGTDMDESTIPVEAGIHRRAIDYDKGCYTGQEVIVRIRDRGRVNWHLRGLLLGEAPAPEPDAELWEPGGERSVGRVTSAVTSPRFGQTAGLGYARREVEPLAELRLEGPDGAPVQVREIGPEGWVDDEPELADD